ncbi:Serine dehydrogenase proteinase [Malonomonas rubra DSM 5091]|uniref:Serine dehydrogenase proteinase n=1 Tax=Malonomonas rubra DSM 5091 TaxID=1122189 RepID=A0A1M6HPV0_MALRU|nr:SppA protein [Malonomonas rubra]SHJ24207.1 Serine dehydrogenase proteinase [Malonomonas rubra DSM 5091]
MTEEKPFKEYDGDVYLYFGSVSKAGYNQLSALYEQKEKNQAKSKKACLILITTGGDPNAGYRIARATNHHYEDFEILIPDICKSAGTLICIGAKKLIFGDRGELGPLDIQISKPDEMFENMSGLDILQALSALQEQMLTSFRSNLIDLRAGSRISTKIAAEVATKLAEGFISPITSHIDPITLGEHERAMKIGYEYGARLNKMADSLKPDAIAKLVASYPSHGFVIDRKEAGELFNTVSAPDNTTSNIYDWARGIIESHEYPTADPIVVDVIDLLQSRAENSPTEKNNEEVDPHNNSDEPGHQEGERDTATQSQTDQQAVHTEFEDKQNSQPQSC